MKGICDYALGVVGLVLALAEIWRELATTGEPMIVVFFALIALGCIWLIRYTYSHNKDQKEKESNQPDV